MSRKKSQRINPESKAIAVPSQSVLPPDQPTVQPSTTKKVRITITGKLYNGIEKSQDVDVQALSKQTIGEVMWAAIELFKRVGGLVEETNEGVIFYPLHDFREVKFTEKVLPS